MIRHICLAATTTLVLTACAGGGATRATDALPANLTLAQVSESTVAAFINACVNTANSPNAASQRLIALGFKATGTRGGRQMFDAPFAVASISQNTQGGGAGQCGVTPKGGNHATSVALMNARMGSATVQATKMARENAWILTESGSVVLISRKGGALTRTQPNVFRG